MEVFETYFRRLVQHSWSLVFPNDPRPGANNTESYQLLAQELNLLSTDPRQAERAAQALDSCAAPDFNYSAFINHFQLGPIEKTALLLASRTLARSDQRSKGRLCACSVP